MRTRFRLSSWRYHTMMLIVTLIFGTNAPISKTILLPMVHGISPYQHMTCRFVGASLLFWMASLFLPQEHIDRCDWIKLLGAALTGIVFNQGLFAIGISMTSPVNQSLISTLGPILTLFLAAFILHEPITRLKGFGVLIGAAGVILLVSANGGSPTASSMGDLICATATLSYSLYLILFKELIHKYHPVTLMKWLFTFGCLVICPISFPDFLSIQWRQMDGSMLGSLAFIVVGATFVTYLLLPFAQRGLRPTVISIYNYGNPVVALTAAILLHQDILTARKLLSALLILLGVFMVTRSKSRAHMLREQIKEKSWERSNRE